MSQPFVSRTGGVLSADIAVPDHDREQRFYSRVLSTGEYPLWQAGSLVNNLGMPVIGLGKQTPEYAHLPLQWMPHIQVADVAAGVQHARDLNGSVLMHAQNEDGASGWAVLADPNGAAFGIIPFVPAEVLPASDGNTAGTVGRIAWLDLTVPDASATRDFYRQVAGWSARDVAIEHEGERYADYIMLGGDGEPAAGVCHARGENFGLPPVWLLYLPVADFAESLRRVEEEGGKVVRSVQGGEGQQTYAVIQDPVGVYLALTPG